MFCPRCGIENPDNGKFCRSCGANLTNVLAVVDGQFALENGAVVENNATEIYSKGVRNVILGLGFGVVSMLLFAMPGKSIFWLFFLIPGFCLLASGVMNILKGEALKKEKTARANAVQQPTLANRPTNLLPDSKTEYVSSLSSFKTKDLVVPSVTEETTKQLRVEK